MFLSLFRLDVLSTLHIGSYEKDINKVSSTEVYARNVELTKKAANTKAEEAVSMEELADEDTELPFN